ncbi:hypothetical protein Cha6605_0751 [Chamaesiphon minutus PCC 6605]|uniref:Uncharacterized protein n=1 Tax=Chamaesiphon minutus (strain ATCC 27169 / PCC 6605) TaxID=1173020 RepID=K9UA80_CHAP6|nr:hypothetical protein Cha6605_0751 [Chamaesiphon minutus PCC 6605]
MVVSAHPTNLTFEILLVEGGFCPILSSNIDIKLQKPTPTDLKLTESINAYRQRRGSANA